MKNNHDRVIPLIIEELEPRILYSAELSPLAADFSHLLTTSASIMPVTTAPITTTQLADTVQMTNQQENQPRHEIVFIDSAVAGYEEIAKKIAADSSATRSLEVIILDKGRDGVDQISMALENRQHLNAIHIISHGEAGEIKIGGSSLNSQSLLANAVAVSNWGSALSAGGDLLVYGCDVAANESGREFVRQLSQLTGANVDASTNLTGDQRLGGDWLLEYSTGSIETSLVLNAYEQTQFNGVLATFTVTNTGNAGAGSFRQAITDANANAGADTIAFNIGSGVQTITLSGALPPILDVTDIDGTTQTGYAASPLIVIDGAATGAVDGLLLDASASGSVIRGLVINNFGTNGIFLNGASNVTIQGNYIGIDSTGTTAQSNANNGIYIANNASNNTIGGTTAAARNIVSGNTFNGIQIDSGTGNTIVGNYIGLNASGNAAISNTLTGIYSAGNTANTIGGTAAGAGNVISGNTSDGILLNASTAYTILGNYIGVDATGTTALGNTGIGIRFVNSADNNTIGGTLAGARNIISGNIGHGIQIDGSSSNTVEGNYIGLDNTGATAVGNQLSGIQLVSGASNNIIGGAAAGARNVISGNIGYGLQINASTANTVAGNYIGVNAAGMAAVSNQQSGIRIVSGAANNIIGGTTAGAGNVVSGNAHYGIQISASSANTLQANYIGVNTAGTGAVANGIDGIQILSASSNNTIGGTSASARNVISGNSGHGIQISASTANTVAGNYIGVSSTGSVALGNQQSGINIVSASSNNIIGGTAAGARNVISGNINHGIQISGSSSNTVEGNYIGLNNTGTTAIGNQLSGIQIVSASSNNTIGGSVAGSGNVVSGNANYGIQINNSSANSVQGNYIGVNAAGSAARGNGSSGIQIENAAGNNVIGGTAASMKNVISGNQLDGIHIDASNGTSIQGNYIGTNAAGTAGISNTNAGIWITASSQNTTIGGTAAGARNVISGNQFAGIGIDGSDGTSIQGNYIGVNAAGTTALANSHEGIWINATQNTTIGGTVAGAKNVISGNSWEGITLTGGSSNTSIQGNYIGLNAVGTAAIANSRDGILIENASNSNTIGGTAAGAGNIISANTLAGIRISGSSFNNMLGNYIGVNVTGTSALGNGSHGVWINTASSNNTIGGTAAGARNVISGNLIDGINVDASTFNRVLGNYIGVDITGAAALPNQGFGVHIVNTSSDNTVGGTTASARNIISGNLKRGIDINNSTSNTVHGNYIGTDITGTFAVGNQGDGIGIFGSASGNIIGGASAGEGNVISGNLGDGMEMHGGSGNYVLGNYIGLNAAGNAAIGNVSRGIIIQIAASNNTIGGTGVGAGNIISGNYNNGISLTGSSNSILGNSIGLDVAGVAAIANQGYGIFIISSSSSNNLIGGSAAGSRNRIAYNTSGGIGILSGTGNQILTNEIFQNNGIGIDLGLNGVTTNDAGDSDSGPNNLQNYPVLSEITISGTQLSVTVTLDSTANRDFRIEFYASPSADPTGFGQGQRYLGFITVTTDAAGHAAIVTTMTASVSAGEVVTATATDTALGDTSEFSAASTVMTVNAAPVNTVPSAQRTNIVTPLVFSSANGNGISVADTDAGNLQVTLSLTSGTLSLSGTTGLTFSTGSGTRDAAMTFFGSIANINSALDGLRFYPAFTSVGTSLLTIISDDPGSSGAGGVKQTTSNVSIAVSMVQQPVTLTIPIVVVDSSSFSTTPVSPISQSTIARVGSGADSHTNNDKPNSPPKQPDSVNTKVNRLFTLLNNTAAAGQERDDKIEMTRTSSEVRIIVREDNALSEQLTSDQQQSALAENLFDTLYSPFKTPLRKFALNVNNISLSSFADGGIGFGAEQGTTPQDLQSMQGGEITAVFLTLGTVWLVTQKSALIASLLASTPAWQRIDPLSILARMDKYKESDTEGKQEKLDMVEHIFSGVAARPAIVKLEEEQYKYVNNIVEQDHRAINELFDP